MRFITLLIALVTLLSSCTEPKTSAITPEIGALEESYAADPSPLNANKLIAELARALGKDHSEVTKKQIISRGMEITEEIKMPLRSIPFIHETLKKNYYPNQNGEHIIKLADIMKSIKKNAAANILYQSYINANPQGALVEKAQANVSEEIDDLDIYILALGEKIFDNPDQFGLNRQNAQNYVDACEAYALANKYSAKSPEHLYKAAEIARSLRTFPKTLSIYDWIVTEYPQYDKTPTAMFLKGFIIENELGNSPAAKDVYTSFLQTYPNHDLADDVKFLLENIGKSNEEILELIEKKKQEKNPS